MKVKPHANKHEVVWVEAGTTPMLFSHCSAFLVSVSFSKTQSIAVYLLYLCFHKLSHAKALLCFIPVRVRMGRAPCTWQLSMGGSRGRRPSSRTVSFCASGVALQGISHVHSCNFQSFWPRRHLHKLLALSWTGSSHSIVPSQPEILVVNKNPSFSSWQWSGWSIQILNLKTRIQRCISVFFLLRRMHNLLVVLLWESWCS